MSNAKQPCLLCKSESDVDELDFGRARHFMCEKQHEFIIRHEAIAPLAASDTSLRAMLTLQALERHSGQILLFQNQQGHPHMEWVVRSKWKLK